MSLVSKLRNDQGHDDTDDSDSESDCATGTVAVDLRVSNLASLHSKHEACDSSAYACHGTDPSRIKEVLRSPPGACGCTMPYKTLHQACRTFWQLGKESQDVCLWSIQQTGDRRKTTWSIEGLWVAKFSMSMFILSYLYGFPLLPSLFRTYCMQNSLATISWHWKVEIAPNWQTFPWNR